MKIRTRSLGCLLLITVFCQTVCLAANSDKEPSADKMPTASQDIPKAEKQKRILDDLLAQSRATKSQKRGTGVNERTNVEDLARPKSLPPSSSDKETQRLYEKALQDYYRYRSHGLEHRKAVFSWQLFSAKMIFAIVVFLVVCGVVFAGIQFRVGLARNVDNLGGDIEVKADSLKVSSPVLGVIILFLSLAFFYFYLVYIYPIENVF